MSAFSRSGGRERNEDACGYLEANGLVCCVLADGAGGHGGGDVAARLSVQSVLNDFVATPRLSVEGLSTMFRNANDTVLQRQQTSDELADMHSTLVVLVFDPGSREAIWGHVGDSRLYMLRNGIIRFRTRDHSLVQALVDSGMLTEEQAQTHPDRNIIVSSLGSRDGFVPTLQDQPAALEDGDAFLLCSDGFWGLIEDRTMETSLAESSSPDDWLERMEQIVTGRAGPDSDNYSAIGVWCGEADDAIRTIPGPG